jgi:hypothetical protein
MLWPGTPCSTLGALTLVKQVAAWPACPCSRINRHCITLARLYAFQQPLTVSVPARSTAVAPGAFGTDSQCAPDSPESGSAGPPDPGQFALAAASLAQSLKIVGTEQASCRQ